MDFYLLGLRITGTIFMIVPWDTIPICLQQIYLQTVARGTAPTSYTLASDITQWLGVATIMCTLPPLATRKMIVASLITAGVLASAIVFLYLVRPGNCRQPILPCHANDIYIISFVSVVQMLLVVAGLRKIVRREASNDSGQGLLDAARAVADRKVDDISVGPFTEGSRTRFTPQNEEG